MLSIGPPSSFKYLIEEDFVDEASGANTPETIIPRLRDKKTWWAGKLCSTLNVKSSVSNKDYENILLGNDVKGKPLLLTSGKNHKKGLDVTSSAPKPVSIIWALANDELRDRISWKNKEAVLEAMQFLEKHAAFTRSGEGGKVILKTIGFVIAMFEHCTSRANDMQLHIHCIIANLTLCEDQKWRTIHSNPIFEWSKAANTVYLSQLAKGMCELGFEIQKSHDEQYFEIKDICRQICKFYSKRTIEIENSIENSGIKVIDCKTKTQFAIQTRAPKTILDQSNLITKWQNELSDLGMVKTHIDKIRTVNFHPTFTPLPILKILSSLTNNEAVIKETHIYKAVATEAQYYNSSITLIQSTVEQILSHYWLLHLGKDSSGREVYTTQMMLDIEKSLIAKADDLRSQNEYNIRHEAIEAAITVQEKKQGFDLSEEQRESVRGVCKTGLDILQGRAGAGKSTSMQAMRIAYESEGHKVKGATIAKKAATQLQKDTGIKSTTFASTLIAIGKHPKRFRNTVILIDEAGLIPSSDLLKLFNGAKIAKAKVVLVGETEQLKSIKHSGCLSYLAKRFSHNQLTSIYRQRQAWARTMVLDLRGGKSKCALKTMKARGLLNIADTKEEALEALVNKWECFIDKNSEKEWMIMAYGWKHVQPLNALVREKLKARKVISNEDIEVECVVSDKKLLLQFSINDRVRFTKNDYRKGLINGDLGTITDIQTLMTEIIFCIRKDSGEKIRFMKSDYSDDGGYLFLVHAYATTVYSSQGNTTDGDTFVFYTPNMDRAASYVAGSRHKDNCHWFVDGQELDEYDAATITDEQKVCSDRIETLARCMSSSRHKGMALEYLEEQHLDD
jgi:conjugative relaxase-like TrwC/TraI family protein